MTGSQIYELTTTLLDGRQMDEVAFYRLLNLAKNKRERKRPWMILRKKDKTTVSLSTSDDFETAKALPSDFGRFYNNKSVQLVSADGDHKYIPQKAFEMQYEHKDDDVCFVEYLAGGSNIYFGGIRSKAYDVWLFYCQISDDITSDTSWVFPPDFAPLLAFDVAIMQKGGIDYDDINARMVQYNGVEVQQLEMSMVHWDAELQRVAYNY